MIHIWCSYLLSFFFSIFKSKIIFSVTNPGSSKFQPGLLNVLLPVKINSVLATKVFHCHEKKNNSKKKGFCCKVTFSVPSIKKERQRINNRWQVTCQKKKDENDWLLWWPVQFGIPNIKKRSVRIKYPVARNDISVPKQKVSYHKYE